MSDTEIPKGAIPVYHSVCEGIAFYTIPKYVTGDLMKGEDAILLDGRHPKAGEAIVCGSCRMKLIIGGGVMTYDVPGRSE